MDCFSWQLVSILCSEINFPFLSPWLHLQFWEAARGGEAEFIGASLPPFGFSSFSSYFLWGECVPPPSFFSPMPPAGVRRRGIGKLASLFARRPRFLGHAQELSSSSAADTLLSYFSSSFSRKATAYAARNSVRGKYERTKVKFEF